MHRLFYMHENGMKFCSVQRKILMHRKFYMHEVFITYHCDGLSIAQTFIYARNRVSYGTENFYVPFVLRKQAFNPYA